MADAGPKIIVDDGIPYLFDRIRQKFLGSRMYLRFGIASRTVSNQYLRMEDGQPSLSVGDMVPRPGTIVGITANTEVPSIWVVEVYKQGVPDPIATLSINNLSKLSNTNYNIDINSGDIIMVKAKGSDIQTPRVIIEITWRL